MSPNPYPLFPFLVVHADWSASPDKRWLCRASLDPDGRYRASPPEPAGPLDTLLHRLRASAGAKAAANAGANPCLLIGFDFPIGLPLAYAERTGIDDFLAILPRLGQDEWADFYHVAEAPEQIGLRRPFYPRRPGSASRVHLLNRLGFQSIDDLRRQCELGHAQRRAACPLFWTLGAQQVGKAAICGWRDVLAPGLRDPSLDLVIWPFAGSLQEILAPGRVVVAETYPAEFYGHLGIAFPRRQPGSNSGKRHPASRSTNAPALLARAARLGVQLDPVVRFEILDGFGPSGDGEDRFDALIGLFGMLNILLGGLQAAEPGLEAIRRIEGWILGQTPETILTSESKPLNV